MKIRNLVALLLVLLLVLSSCSSDKEKTFVYEAKDEGYSMTISLVARGDILLRQINLGEVDFFMLDLDSKSEAEAFLKPMADALKDLKGIDYKLDFTDEVVIEELVIDFEKADLESYSKISTPLMQWDGGEVSLEEARALLEKQGFTEVK